MGITPDLQLLQTEVSIYSSLPSDKLFFLKGFGVKRINEKKELPSYEVEDFNHA